MPTLEQLTSLGLAGNVSNHGARRANEHTLRRQLIHYPQFCAAVREIAGLHQRWRLHGIAGAILLYGQSGSGKTTVLNYYAQQFPRKVRNEAVQIPVLQALTPESPTVKSLAEAILVSLGDPAAGRGSAATKTVRIINFFKRCSVELLILDEFHHFYEGHRVSEGRKVSDWLKNLISSCEIPVVLCGLPRSIAALNANTQLRRRFSAPHHLKEFGFSTEAEQLEFRAVLKAMEDAMPYRAVKSISSEDTARRFYFATAGLIDYVVKTLDRVVADFDLAKEVPYELPSLGSAFRKEIWAEVPDGLNPFLAQARHLRLLTDVREPFDGWDDPGQYTLSARAAALLGRSRPLTNGEGVPR